jgi:hypothetical protein
MAAAVALCAISGSAWAGGGLSLPSGPYFLQSGDDIFGASNFNYLNLNDTFGFNVLDYASPKPDPSFGIGSTSGHFPTGASVSVYANAIAGFSGYASATNSLNWTYDQHVDTLIEGADQYRTATVGSTFTIGSLSSFGAYALSTGAGDFETETDAYENIGVGAHLEGCLVGLCHGTDIGIGDGPNGHSTVLAAYSSATNTVTAFGQTYGSALPQTYSDPSNLFSATVYKPDLSGARQGADSHVAALSTTAHLGGVSFDVAAAAAAALGIPSEALKDSILGFHYETIGAYVGAGIDLDQTVVLEPLLVDHIYHFTSPVEVLDDTTGLWGAPTVTIDLAPDQFAQVRAPDTLSLGVIVENKASFETVTSVQLETYVQGQLVILHIHGHGLDDSLVNTTFDLSPPATLLDASDNEYVPSQSVIEPAINLEFGLPDEVICPSCGNAELVTISFPAGGPGATPGADPDDTTNNLIFKTLNFGTQYCNDAVKTGCVLDTSIRPYSNTTRSVLRDGKRVYETSASGFAQADALLGLPSTGPIDPIAEQAALRQILLSTYPGGVRPDIDLPTGVPEPATWAGLIFGAAMIGAVSRRRRRRVSL